MKRSDTTVHLLSTQPGAGWASAGGGGVQAIGSFTVYTGTNFGRIALLAQEAKRTYKSFGRADVPEDLLEPAVYVTVIPDEPDKVGSSLQVASPIEHVVLKSKVNPEAVA
jgi:hypothetical protein